MATLNLDTLTDISAVEQDGVVVELVREGIIYGLTGTDFEVLYTAGAVSGLPVVNSSPGTRTELRLVKRTFSMIPNELDKCRVRLEYTTLGLEPYNFIFSGGTSLNQIQTQKDINGNLISVSHTFPAGDDDWPSETKEQGGDVPVLIPQTNLRATGVLLIDYPIVISRRWVGSMNAYFWAGGNPWTWMCTAANFKPLNLGVSPRQWTFDFEFQFSLLGWQPTVYFVDPRDGKPPPNLVDGVGIKTVTWYPELDFAWLFPDT